MVDLVPFNCKTQVPHLSTSIFESDFELTFFIIWNIMEIPNETELADPIKIDFWLSYIIMEYASWYPSMAKILNASNIPIFLSNPMFVCFALVFYLKIFE